MEVLDQPSNETGNDTPQVIIPIPFYRFSEHSPYLITCHPRETDPTTPDLSFSRRDCPEYDSKYFRTISPPWQSLSEVMQGLILNELRDLFFEQTATELRSLDTYAVKWRQILGIPLVKWRRPGDVDIKPEDIIKFLNKEVMIYLDTKSIADNSEYGSLGRYIYREWLHLYNGRPPFQRGGFFAKATRFHDPESDGLDRLSAFHKDLSQMLSAHLDDYVDFYPYDMRSQTIPPPHYQPIPDRAIQSFRNHGYLLRPLFRALYIFVDGQALAEFPGPMPAQRGEAECHLAYRQRVHIQAMSRVSVLIVKTGDESHLSSPISLLPLFDAGLALNVNRPDYQDGIEPTVARVKLDVAIRFVWELLMKEETASSETAKQAQRLREEQQEFCEAWVRKVVIHSQEVGIDTNGYSWTAIRRALARKNGEAFEYDQIVPWWELLRHWTG
ncbi:hypothetical protein NM208_g4001 [Fusarium decemcellulare]|uniref:Uncharacterized protein n=2 Tax=Fusarium decemcellulare TaxID=57161 RepID=A0ACC1SM92_9HYPO|nr:hypothetical protein NM208_g9617 [Fusarium decemcellulare]KAJ3542615.1 hypothetical protein NM208_g4001 [Fusarium decemcellulare]